MPPCCDPVRERRNGFNCGEFLLDSGRPGYLPLTPLFPWVTNTRIGNWVNPSCPPIAPYAPDSLLVYPGGDRRSTDGDAGGFRLTRVSPCLFRSGVLTRDFVPEGALDHSTGYRQHYYELAIGGTSPGSVTLTDVTTSSTDPSYPTEVVWLNKSDMTDLDILTLELSTQFQDDESHLKWLFPDGHGQPHYTPDGHWIPTAGYVADPNYTPASTGHIFCAMLLVPGKSKLPLCGRALITGFDRFAYGNVETVFPVSGRFFERGDPGDLGDLGDRGQTAYDGSEEMGLSDGTDYTTGDMVSGHPRGTWGNLKVEWTATATGVDVVVTATVNETIGGVFTNGTQLVVWEFPDQPYDWWRSTLTGSALYDAKLYTGGTVVREATLTLTLYECSGYYGIAEGTPCLEQSVYGTISDHSRDPETYEMVAPARDVAISVEPLGFGSTWIVRWQLTFVSTNSETGVTTWSLRIWGFDTAPPPNGGTFSEYHTITSTCDSSGNLVLSASLGPVSPLGFHLDLFTT